jgi:hypothetical protein
VRRARYTVNLRLSRAALWSKLWLKKIVRLVFEFVDAKREPRVRKAKLSFTRIARCNSSERKRPYSRVLYIVLFDTSLESESATLYSKFYKKKITFLDGSIAMEKNIYNKINKVL